MMFSFFKHVFYIFRDKTWVLKILVRAIEAKFGSIFGEVMVMIRTSQSVSCVILSLAQFTWVHVASNSIWNRGIISPYQKVQKFTYLRVVVLDYGAINTFRVILMESLMQKKFPIKDNSLIIKTHNFYPKLGQNYPLMGW